jgi:hypothetical protein
MYATLDQLKTYVGATDTTDDLLLTDCLTRAQAMIDSATSRRFEAAADSTRTFDGVVDVSRGGRTLWLDGDLCALTSITNGDGGSVTPVQVVSEPRNSTPYYALTLKASSGLVWTYETDPEDAISVTGRWAYSVTPPADIEQACIRLAAWLYRQKDSSADLDRPVVSADGATLMPAQVPADVQAILKLYRRVAV